MHKRNQAGIGLDSQFDANAIIDSLPGGVLLEGLSDGLNAISMMLLTKDGRYVFANQLTVNGFQGVTTETIKGMSLYDLGPRVWMDERISFFHKAVEEDRTIFLLEVIEGVRLSSRIHPLKISNGSNPLTIIMVTVEPIIATHIKLMQERSRDENVFFAKHIDLGRMNVLSDREIEVLALMGQGHRTREIAEKLSRSVSTINRHRESIGEKVGVKDRAKLIRLANVAVLQPEDSQRVRMQLNPSRQHHKGPEGFNTRIENRIR